MFSNFQDYVILFHDVVILPHNHTKISQQKILQNDNKIFLPAPVLKFCKMFVWLCTPDLKDDWPTQTQTQTQCFTGNKFK